MDDKFKSKWIGNNFFCDQKEYLGYQGLSWPQRNYICNFCNKEYKSAQALGGHMNVHRRDRARLRLSSPPPPPPLLDHHHNPNPNPNYPSPPSPIRYLPYKTNHSSPALPLISTTKTEDEGQKIPLFVHSARDILGCMRKSVTMGDGEKENDIRVSKKNEIFNMEMEMGLVEDGNIDVDLELRLGRS